MENPSRSFGVQTQPTELPETFMEDLALILEEEWAPYLCLGPGEAILAVKKPDAFAFGEHVSPPDWIGKSPRQRAEFVVSWIRKAAEYCKRPQERQSCKGDRAA